MDKKKQSVSLLLSRFRGWIQAAATLLTNIHLPHFFKGGLYQGKGKPVLQDIDLHIEAGQTIGILGGKSSAKTSHLNQISRLYALSDSCVRDGGHEERE